MQENINHSDESGRESESADPDFETLLGSLDIDSLRSFHPGACPPLKDLIRVADQSLEADRRAEIEAHLAQCPACACLMMQVREVSAPIARFHKSSIFAMAWQHLRSKGRLNRPLEEAWERHRQHCESCERRARLLVQIGIRQEHETVPVRGRRLQRLVPAGTFGLGVALTVLIMTRLAPLPTSGTTDHGTESGTETRSIATGIPDSSTQGILDLLLRPTPSRLESTLDTWGNLNPDLKMQSSVALGGICLQEADAEKDSDRKANWLKRSEKELMTGREEIDRKLVTVRHSLSLLPNRSREKHSDDPSPGKE